MTERLSGDEKKIIFHCLFDFFPFLVQEIYFMYNKKIVYRPTELIGD